MFAIWIHRSASKDVMIAGFPLPALADQAANLDRFVQELITDDTEEITINPLPPCFLPDPNVVEFYTVQDLIDIAALDTMEFVVD